MKIYLYFMIFKVSNFIGCASSFWKKKFLKSELPKYPQKYECDQINSLISIL